MKAILEFNLPDEQSEFTTACTGAKWVHSMWELDQWLRSQMKYHDHEMSEDEYNAYERVRDKLYEVMSNNNISFDG